MPQHVTDLGPPGQCRVAVVESMLPPGLVFAYDHKHYTGNIFIFCRMKWSPYLLFLMISVKGTLSSV